MRIALALALLALYLWAPRLTWDHGLKRVRPGIYSGDEPHYLIMVNSLLFDHDLRLDADYERVKAGGLDMGAEFKGKDFDHHTVIIDTQTGEHMLWRSVYDWPNKRNCKAPCVPFVKKHFGFDPAPQIVEMPAHPIAFSALVALLIAPFARTLDGSEQLAVEAVALLAWLAVIATFFVARKAGFTLAESLAAAALLGVASPLLPYARSFFSEPAIALALALAVLALISDRPVLAGIACAAAAAMKQPYGLAAVGWAVLLWREGRLRDALKLAGAAAAGALAIVLFNFATSRTPLLSGALPFVPEIGLGGLGELLFSNNHGLFNFAPWTLAAFFGWREPLVRRMAVGALPVMAAFSVSSLQGGGYCYGPRYLVPFLPWLAIACVAAWRSAGTAWRGVIAALALYSLVLAVPSALRYRLLFDRPSINVFRR